MKKPFTKGKFNLLNNNSNMYILEVTIRGIILEIKQ